MIKETLQEIRRNQKIAKSDIIYDKRTLNTQMGNIERAKESVKDLSIQLRAEILQNAIFILVKGKNSKKFAEIAQEEYSCITVEADAIHKKIIEGISETFLGKSASPALFDVAMSRMSDISHEVGISGYNYVNFKNEDAVQLNTREDMLKLIVKAFNREMGAELAGIYAVHVATTSILESDFDGNKVPLILYSDNEEMLGALEKDIKQISKDSFVVNTKKKIDSESVQEELIRIKKSL